MQKYHDEPKQYKGYLKSALATQANSSACLVGLLSKPSIPAFSNSAFPRATVDTSTSGSDLVALSRAEQK